MQYRIRSVALLLVAVLCSGLAGIGLYVNLHFLPAYWRHHLKTNNYNKELIWNDEFNALVSTDHLDLPISSSSEFLIQMPNQTGWSVRKPFSIQSPNVWSEETVKNIDEEYTEDLLRTVNENLYQTNGFLYLVLSPKPHTSLQAGRKVVYDLPRLTSRHIWGPGHLVSVRARLPNWPHLKGEINLVTIDSNSDGDSISLLENTLNTGERSQWDNEFHTFNLELLPDGTSHRYADGRKVSTKYSDHLHRSEWMQRKNTLTIGLVLSDSELKGHQSGSGKVATWRRPTMEVDWVRVYRINGDMSH